MKESAKGYSFLNVPKHATETCNSMQPSRPDRTLRLISNKRKGSIHIGSKLPSPLPIFSPPGGTLIGHLSGFGGGLLAALVVASESP